MSSSKLFQIKQKKSANANWIKQTNANFVYQIEYTSYFFLHTLYYVTYSRFLLLHELESKLNQSLNHDNWYS